MEIKSVFYFSTVTHKRTLNQTTFLPILLRALILLTSIASKKIKIETCALSTSKEQTLTLRLSILQVSIMFSRDMSVDCRTRTYGEDGKIQEIITEP